MNILMYVSAIDDDTKILGVMFWNSLRRFAGTETVTRTLTKYK